MKTLFFSILFLLSHIVYSQNNLLDFEKDSIVSFMKENRKDYKFTKDTVTFSGVNYLEYFYKNKNIPENGICAYVFYFENFYSKKCTSIRVIILSEKIDLNIEKLNELLIKVDKNKWMDNTSLFSMYTIKNLKTNDTFYLLDINKIR